MSIIYCENRNPFEFADRYNGVDYEFPPGARIPIPNEAARHIFGFGEADRMPNLVRLGWANLPGEEGVRRLANFVFSGAVTVPEDSVDRAVLEEIGRAGRRVPLRDPSAPPTEHADLLEAAPVRESRAPPPARREAEQPVNEEGIPLAPDGEEDLLALAREQGPQE